MIADVTFYYTVKGKSGSRTEIQLTSATTQGLCSDTLVGPFYAILISVSLSLRTIVVSNCCCVELASCNTPFLTSEV